MVPHLSLLSEQVRREDERERTPNLALTQLLCLTCDLWQRLGTFSIKSQAVNIVGFSRYSASVTAPQLRHCVMKAAMPNTEMSTCGCVPTIINLQDRWWPEFGLQDVVCWCLVYGINFEFGLQPFTQPVFLPGISKISFEWFDFFSPSFSLL